MGKNTHVAVGNAADISDIITNITPKVTPFLSACPKTKATATKHQWLEDSLKEPGANAEVEGFTYDPKDPDPRKELDNVAQIFQNGYGVTKTQEAVLKHGVKSEIGYQMAKAAKEHARDIEWALLRNATKDPATETTPRKLGGVQAFVTSNVIPAAGALTEGLLNDALQAAWAEGGNPTVAYLSGAQKRVVSSFSGEGDKYLDQNAKKLRQSISVYESDFGILSFTPHRMMPDDQVYVIDPDYWKVAQLRPAHRENLPNSSDMHRKLIVSELTLEARAEKASARITGLTV